MSETARQRIPRARDLREITQQVRPVSRRGYTITLSP